MFGNFYKVSLKNYLTISSKVSKVAKSFFKVWVASSISKFQEVLKVSSKFGSLRFKYDREMVSFPISFMDEIEVLPKPYQITT
jgi:hypothetical protein